VSHPNFLAFEALVWFSDLTMHVDGAAIDVTE